MRILVLGELFDDRFVYGAAVRLSPECPTPVFVPRHESSNAGGAGNVAANIKSLRPDWEVEHVFQRERIVKRRFVDESSGYILLRVDEGDRAAVIEAAQLEALLKQKWDAIAISDYHKGFLNERSLNEVFGRADCGVTFMDTKKALGNWSLTCDVVKINRKEFEAQPQGAAAMCRNLVVTLGKDGAALYTEEREVFRDGGRPVAIRSVAGAGDSFQAGLVVNFLEKRDLTQAVKFANLVANVAVSKVGVAAVKQSEIDEQEMLSQGLSGRLD